MKLFPVTALTAALTFGAYAQEPDPANPNLSTVSNEDSTAKSFWEWDYFTGDWGGLRTTLSDKGLDF
ncbi:MAG TPA: hypothetical protein VIS74_01260, partial [Chthoniobacterales bacterium]